MLVDQQCVAVVTDTHWLRGAGKLHFVVAATVAKDAATISVTNFLLNNMEGIKFNMQGTRDSYAADESIVKNQTFSIFIPAVVFPSGNVELLAADFAGHSLRILGPCTWGAHFLLH